MQAVNGLREFLQLERKQIFGDILFETDRLECEFFDGTIPASPAMSLPAYEPPRLVNTSGPQWSKPCTGLFWVMVTRP